PVGGSVIFSIGAPSTRPAAQGGTDAGVRVALWAVKLVIYAGLFIGVGGALFRSWFSDSVAPAPLACVVALLCVLVANLLSLGLQGLDALELPLSELPRKAAWETGLTTAYGRTAIVSALAMLAGLLAFAAKSVRLARGFAAVGLLGAGVALALSG